MQQLASAQAFVGGPNALELTAAHAFVTGSVNRYGGGGNAKGHRTVQPATDHGHAHGHGGEVLDAETAASNARFALPKDTRTAEELAASTKTGTGFRWVFSRFR